MHRKCIYHHDGNVTGYIAAAFDKETGTTVPPNDLHWKYALYNVLRGNDHNEYLYKIVMPGIKLNMNGVYALYNPEPARVCITYLGNNTTQY
jgi:hypothetical protein